MKTNHANWDYRNRRVDALEAEARIMDEGRDAFLDVYDAALDALKAVDPNWEAWYDARPEQTCGEMLPLIRARTAELSADLMDFDPEEAAVILQLDCLGGEELQETRRLVGV